MNLLNILDTFISQESTKTYFTVALTFLLAILADNLFKSFIKVPKTFDSKRAQTYVTIFRNIITVIVYAVALHIILAELNIDITPLLASAGVIGVIIGIGARTIIEDLITGLFLISQDKIAIGDYIKIDDIEGNIENIGIRTLTIRGGDGSLTIIPNGLVKKLINYSRHRSSYVINIPVKSDQKIDLVQKAAEEALEKLKNDTEFGPQLYTGSAVTGIDGFKDMNVMFYQIILVTPPPLRWAAAKKYRYYIKKAFEKHKIIFG